MSGKIRLLYYGDAPTVATGFGTVSRGILNHLHSTGKYNITVFGVNYWGNPHKCPYDIWPIGIGSNDPYGRQKAADMMVDPKNQFDALLMLQDTFILQFMRDVLPKLKTVKKFFSAVYFPIDGTPKPEWIEAMSLFDKCFTYTEFGKKESILACPDVADKISVVPHGVDTSVFFPVTRDQAMAFRQEFFKIPDDRFLITNVNRNQQRKDFPRTLLAFRELKKKRPNSVLYLHCAARDQGWNLPEVVKGLGLVMGKDVLMPGSDFGPNQGYPIEFVNMIYNSSDAVVSTTVGEGWGLSSTEAMATKTPVVFPNNTSLTEIIGEERGYLYPSGETLDHFAIIPNDNEVLRPLASVTGLAKALVHVYDNREEAAAKAETAYEWVKSSLSWTKNIGPAFDKAIQKGVVDMVRKESDNAPSFVSSAEF